MTGTVHEWFKSAATSLHTWSSHATLLWQQAAGFAETSPAQETTTQTRVFTKGMATYGSPLPLQSLSLESTSGYDYSICPSHAQETMTQTYRVCTMNGYAYHWQPFASTIRISQLDMWSFNHGYAYQWQPFAITAFDC